MNASIFWRLLWKEYRTERSFWIAMVGLAVFMELLLLVSAGFVDEARWAVGGSQRLVLAFGFAIALPAFYALGCGATAFAAEHETGTFQFQRLLPVTPWRLVWSKLVFAAISTIAMVALLWPIAAAFSGGRLPSSEQAVGLWALWGLAAVELLVWGTLFSLVSTQPLKATILAVATASLVVHLTTAFYVHSPADYFHLAPYRAALPPRIAIVVAIGLVDVWLGTRWFRERAAMLSVESVAAVERTAQASGHVDPRSTVSGAAGFGRLVWQATRQNASLLGVFGLLAVPVIVLGGSLWINTIWTPSPSGGWHPQQQTPGMALLATFLVALIGASTFHADQRRLRFRFLAERGVSPRGVWWSRQLVWMTAAGMITVVTAIGMLPMLADFVGRRVPLAVSFALPASMASAYAAGQLTSMVFRSGILAAVFGVLLAGLLSIWTGLMVAGGVPLIWSVAPIPIVLLAATRVRTADWLRERGGLRGWLPMTLVLVLPAVAILTAVPFYRVYEIPVVSPGFSPEAYFRPATAEEKTTLEMYQKAWRLSQGGDRAELIAVTLDASRRKQCDCFDPLDDRVFVEMGRLALSIVGTGQELQKRGELDAALDRYLAALRMSVQMRQRASQLEPADSLERNVYFHLMDWASASGQTAERVGKAAVEIGRITENLPSRTTQIKSDYFVLGRIIDGDAEAMAHEGMDQNKIISTTLWLRWMPWERARAHRLLNVLTARKIDQLEQVELAMANGQKVLTSLYNVTYDFRGTNFQGTWLPDHFRWRYQRSGQDALDMETRRRAARLQLAVRAWKLDHGELPKTLDVLVGPYFDRLPLDPYSAEPFRWFPKGVPTAIIPPDQRGWTEPNVVVQPDTPIVWSAGPLVLQYPGVPEVGTQFASIRSSVHSTEWRRPSTQLQVWRAGWAFPLPQ